MVVEGFDSDLPSEYLADGHMLEHVPYAVQGYAVVPEHGGSDEDQNDLSWGEPALIGIVRAHRIDVFHQSVLSHHRESDRHRGGGALAGSDFHVICCIASKQGRTPI